MEPLTYLAGGLLGDFINQLSVIQEVYKLTGRKGFLFVSNRGHEFRFGLEQLNTYMNIKFIKKKYMILTLLNGENHLFFFINHGRKSFNLLTISHGVNISG
jgi:hypothetical protein